MTRNILDQIDLAAAQSDFEEELEGYTMLIATMYKQMIDKGLPEALASELVIQFNMLVLTNGRPDTEF